MASQPAVSQQTTTDQVQIGITSLAGGKLPASPAPRQGESHLSAASQLPPPSSDSMARANEPITVEELNELKKLHKEIKGRLRDYETRFHEEHGRKPVKQKDWGPVWNEFNEYTNLRTRIANAEKSPLVSAKV